MTRSCFIPVQSGAALAALALLLVGGCDQPPNPNATARPTSPLSPPALPSPPSSERLDLGRRLAAQAFGVLSSNLLGALARSTPADSLEFCSVNAGPLLASVAAPPGTTLRRVSHRARNPANRAGAAELALIESYRRGLEAGRTNPPVVVTNATGTATFYAPILLANPLCLQCHGLPGVDIATNTLAAIDRLYPADAARGFRLGDLRGLWAISLP